MSSRKDDRFNSMHTAPIFKASKKDSFKVKVDDRFKTMLTDTRFQSVPGQTDRYGRKVSSGKGKNNKVVKEMKELGELADSTLDSHNKTL